MIMISEPRCMGMCSAWAMTSPRTLNSAVEQSWRSLMLVEYDGLDERLAHLLGDGEQRGADHLERDPIHHALPARMTRIGALVHQRLLAGEDDGGRVHLLDDGGAGDAVAGAEPLAAIDRRVDEARPPRSTRRSPMRASWLGGRRGPQRGQRRELGGSAEPTR